MTEQEVTAAARYAFRRRDVLERQLRVVDAELSALRSSHMKATRQWGVRMEAFRAAVFNRKIA